MRSIPPHMMLSLSAAVFALAGLSAGFPAAAVESESQDVVVTLQQEPLKNLEASCVAIQIGMSQLAMGSRVTLFPTLGGVGVVNQEVLESLYPDDDADDNAGRPGKGGGHAYGRDKGRWAEPELCVAAGPDGNLVNLPLRDLLDRFVDAGGNIVVCPLCWFSRNPETAVDPEALAELLYEPAVIGGAGSIPLLFHEANKVIDF